MQSETDQTHKDKYMISFIQDMKNGQIHKDRQNRGFQVRFLRFSPEKEQVPSDVRKEDNEVLGLGREEGGVTI